MEKLVTDVMIIYIHLVPICPAYVDTINLQTQNSTDLLPKIQNLIKSDDLSDVSTFEMG